MGAVMADARTQLERIQDAMIEDIMAMSDEEILAEAWADGIDVDALTTRMRKVIAAAMQRATSRNPTT